MKQKSLGMNAVLNGIKQCCSILFPLITFPYVSRILGNEGYGKYSFSNSITNYFILFAALGISTYAIREGAKIRDDKEEINSFCSQLFSINVCSAFVSFMALGLMLIFMPKLNLYQKYILVQSTAIIMNVIGTDWVNGIFEDYFYITVRYIAVQFICLIAMFIFVRTSNDIIAYCVISVLAANGGNLINVLYVRRYAKIRFTFNMEIKKHLVPLLVLFMNSIAISIYVNSDITMLGFFESDGNVGIYSFSSKIYNLIKQLINAVIVVAVPRIAYVAKNQAEKYEGYINKVFVAMNFVLLPVVVGMFFMSASLITIAGGEQYIAGDVSLKILSIATLFAIYASLFTNCILIVHGQEKSCLVATVYSAIINVALNIVLIPLLGMNGAAITTVIAELVNCTLQMKYSRKFFDWKKLNIRALIPCVCGSALVAAVCILCNSLLESFYIRIIAAIGISFAAYGLVLLLMRKRVKAVLLG